MAGVSRKTLADLAELELKAIANTSYYRAEIPTTPPTISPADLRVKPYTVLWPSPGAPGDERAQDDAPLVDLQWRFIVSCVAGDPATIDVLVDHVFGRFHGWRPVLPGLSVGTCAQDFDPGPPQADRSSMPARFYLQMPFLLHVGA